MTLDGADPQVLAPADCLRLLAGVRLGRVAISVNALPAILPVRFTLDLIAEDEGRHHRLYDEWARTVREMVLVTEPGDAVPDLTREPDPDRLVAAVDDLLAVEKDDAQQLKVLEKSLKDVRHTTVWPLLVELMEMDTRKHIKILEFLREHAQHTARGR